MPGLTAVVTPRRRFCNQRSPVVVRLQAKQQLDANGNEYIRLDGFMKCQGLASTGGQAKVMINDGMVEVNGIVETRRGRKLRRGDRIHVQGVEPPMQVEFD